MQVPALPQNQYLAVIDLVSAALQHECLLILGGLATCFSHLQV